MTQESEQDTIYDSSSSSTNVEQSDYHGEITKLRTELTALKTFLVEQLHFIKQSVNETFEFEKNSHQENYISRLVEDINHLNQENKTKSPMIQSLIQSGNTDNYDTNNSNSGIENEDMNTRLYNNYSNITMRHRKNKNKSSKDKSTYINNKDKNSNKINSKNDNSKNNTENKYHKSSESSRRGLNYTIINTSTYNQKEQSFHYR